MILGLLLSASAADHHVVRPDDTLESIVAAGGGTFDADALRAKNGLAPDATLVVGQILTLPGVEDDRGGLVLALAGTATVAPPGTPPTAVGLGDTLPPGATVCTGAASYATIRVASSPLNREHDEVALLPQTCVRLNTTTNHGARRSSVLTVDQGSIAVRSATSEAGTVTVVTRDGVTSSVGGGFRLTVEGTATRTEALYRGLSVIGGGVDQKLEAGFGSRVKQGNAPDAPTRLLAPGSPLQPGLAPMLRAEFTWSPVERALGYRVEIAADRDFASFLYVEDVAAEDWRPELLSLPYRNPGLWWRVASFDRTGFLGLPSDPARLVVPPAIQP